MKKTKFENISMPRIKLPKRLMAALTAVVLMFGMLAMLGNGLAASGSCTCPAPTATACGATFNNLIQIACEARLRSINTSNATRAQGYILIHDIRLTENWTPIGSQEAINTAGSPFTGTFDGGGHTVSNIRISLNRNNSGFFGFLNNSAVVKNLTLEYSAGGITGTGERKGGLTGNAFGGTVIDNVHVIGVPNASGELGGSALQGSMNYIGGLVGYLRNSTVTNSSVENFNISGSIYVAGFVGAANNGATIRNCHVTNVRIGGSGPSGAAASYSAGFAGVLYGTNPVRITTASVNGAIVTTGGSYPGGFAGAAHLTSSIEDAFVNNVQVTSTGGSYPGGFIGALYENSTIKNAGLSHATVNGRLNYAGGFAGVLYNNSRVEKAMAKDVTVHTPATYAGGFSGVIHDRSTITNASVINATVSSGSNYAGGFTAALYDNAVVRESRVVDSDVRGGGYWAGGFAGEIMVRAEVTDSFVVNTSVRADNYGAGGFVGIIYGIGSKALRNGVSRGTVVSNSHSAGGFAGAIHGSALLEVNFAENTNVRGTNRVGGFVGELMVTPTLNNNYANGWTRPAPTEDNPTPGPRPGLSAWKDANGNMIPARVEGTSTSTGGADSASIGGFAGRHGAYYYDYIGTSNAYSAIEVVNVFNGGRGGFTGEHRDGVGTVTTGLTTAGRIGQGVYRGTHYFDDLSSNSIYSPDPFPVAFNPNSNTYTLATNPIPTFVGVPTLLPDDWRGDSYGQNVGGNSFPQDRVTGLMVQRSTFEGWTFAAANCNHTQVNCGPWHIEEGISYPYFLFGDGVVGYDWGIAPDWERLRTAINSITINKIDNTAQPQFSGATIVIHPYNSTVLEDLKNGILVIQDKRTGNGLDDLSPYYINSTGRPIDVPRNVSIVSENTNATLPAHPIVLYTRKAEDGRHFIMRGGSDVRFGNIRVDGFSTAGGISVEMNSPHSLTLRNWVLQGSAVIHSSAAIQNCATTSNGGGISVSANSNLILSGALIIRNNRAAFGGGVYVSDGASFTMNAGLINGNRAVDGAGIWSLGRLNISNGIINGNMAQANGGGVWNGDIFTMSNGSIYNNSARTGGGIATFGTFAFTGGTIGGALTPISGGVVETRNKAINGGGIANAGTFAIDGGTINAGNDAEVGGSLWNSGTIMIIERNGTRNGTINGDVYGYEPED